MSWITLSLIAPLFWTWNAIMDQVVVRGFFKEKSEAALFIGSLGNPLLMIIFAVLYPNVLQVSILNAVYFSALGAYLTLCFYPYFKAVERTESSILISIFQMTPMLVFLWGWLFLGETAGVQSLLGALTIVIASIFITFDFNTKTIDKRAFLLVGLSALLLSFQFLLTRAATLEHDWKAIAFWMGAGSFLTGIITISFFKTYRDIFKDTLKKRSRKYLVICLSQEVIYYTGILCAVAAIAKTPSVGLAKSLMSIEPVYAFLTAVICGFFFPHIFESIGLGRIFLWRLLCILITIFGVYLIYAN